MMQAKPEIVDVVVQEKRTPLGFFQLNYLVYPMWSGVDRPQGYTWGTAMKHEAEALAQAIRDGKVFGSPEVRTDVNGKTYVEASVAVIGKRLGNFLAMNGYA